MIEFKYHPLVDADTEGTTKVPMFFAMDVKTVKEHHNMFLAEMIPGYFRLHSKKPMTQEMTDQLSIFCPMCGQELHRMANNADCYKLGLYTCNHCR